MSGMSIRATLSCCCEVATAVAIWRSLGVVARRRVREPSCPSPAARQGRHNLGRAVLTVRRPTHRRVPQSGHSQLALTERSDFCSRPGCRHPQRWPPGARAEIPRGACAGLAVASRLSFPDRALHRAGLTGRPALTRPRFRPCVGGCPGGRASNGDPPRPAPGAAGTSPQTAEISGSSGVARPLHDCPD